MRFAACFFAEEDIYNGIHPMGRLNKVLHQSKASRIRKDNKSIPGKKRQNKNGSWANGGQISKATGAARHHDLGTSLHAHNDIAPDDIFSNSQLLLTTSE